MTLTLDDFDALASYLDADPAEGEVPEQRPRYNIAPLDTHWIVRSGAPKRELTRARWGLVNHWATDASTASRLINARAETARERPAFREAFARRRCVVPADGFYEWKGPKSDRRPLWFHARDGRVLQFAGLWESWTDPASGRRLRTFTVLTTASRGLIAEIHDRMPVILPPAHVDLWLGQPKGSGRVDLDRLGSLLEPATPDFLDARGVGRRVNDVRNDDLECLAPLVDVEQPAPVRATPRPSRSKKKDGAQGSLF